MSVERLTRLFEALGNPASVNPSIANVSVKKPAEDVSQAVRLAPGFGTQPSQSSDDRASKVAQIKADVAAGTYRPDSKEVARALVRDLFVV